MFRNYLKIALRNLLRHKVFSCINILGLAIGMSACLLIVLFIADELSFDQQYENRERIYRLEGNYERGGKTMEHNATANFGVAPLLRSVFPEIENYVRFTLGRGIVKHKNKVYEENRICYSDSSFFRIFSFQFITGNKATALDGPNMVVITEPIAKKYFGDQNPVGQLVEIDNKLLKVTGVFQEAPRTSHFHPDIIISVRTIASEYPHWVYTPNTCGISHYTYLLLPEHFDYQKLQSQLDGFIRTHIGKDHNKFMQLTLQPLTKIHLYSHSPDELEAAGDITYIYIFGIVASVILIIAFINYINLTTAKAIDRAKEIGLRKVTGASKLQLVIQFLGESVLIVLPAMLIAYAIALFSMPVFNRLSGKALTLDLTDNLQIILYVICFSLFIGIAAGVYPAFFMSSFKITRVLKGNVTKTQASSLALRKGLVVFQFCVSVVLIISTLLIYSQVQFIHSKKLGINAEQLITVELTEKTGEQFKNLKTDLLQNSAILAVTSANNDLTSGGTNWRQYQWKNNSRNDFNIATMDVDEDFFSALDAKIISGRGFSKDYPGDINEAYVINESAAKILNLENPINEALDGSIFNGKEGGMKYGKIVGVAKDFHFASLHQEIKPVVFNLQSPKTDRPAYMWLRIQGSAIPASIDHLQNTWKKFDPEYPVKYSFLDDDIQKLYRAEQNFLSVFMIFACLAIFIASLGIFGLAFYTTLQRTKEIGIRKTLGASVSSIVFLLSKDFTKLVALSFFIAVPLAWYIMIQWLENYAYRINVGPGAFVISGCFTILIAWLTVSYQSIKAALVNPVKSLKVE